MDALCGKYIGLQSEIVVKYMLISIGLPGEQDDESDLEDGDGSDGDDDDEDAESVDEEGAQLIPARADRLQVC